MSAFSFNKDSREEELNIILKNSNPPYLRNIKVSISKADFNLGHFYLLINIPPAKNFEVCFDRKSIDNFRKFIETLIEAQEPLIFPLFNKGEEIFIYCAPYNKTDIRFSILDTIELSRKEKQGKIIKYSYTECCLDIDVLLNKRLFVKEFYNSLKEIYQNYMNIAFFESVEQIFDVSAKDSNKITNYLKCKTPD